MSRVRGKNTRPEIALKSSLRRLGIRYRSYRKIAGATVDAVLPDRRMVVLVHGCFWHGCPTHYKVPKSRVRYWREKVATNRDRDRRQTRALTRAGWKVVVVWEHSLRRDPDRDLARRLVRKS